MYYIYKNKTEEIFVSERKPAEYSDLFEVDELPFYPSQDHSVIKLMADFDNKSVWYDVQTLPEANQLEIINSNILVVMEGMAAAYEEQTTNSMNIMEGLAAIYETQIGGA
ncbi:hypothetical protein [Dielma fastidiosa]|uniref:hypothetical protein n=1 Tax=Dielma fastidiosa TaxID=1034346 RepID=UPI0023F1B104|nr:hypothetical protein [Dielma fastidiosa]